MTVPHVVLHIRREPWPRLTARVHVSDPVPIILGNLGLLVDNRPTNAALLLFGREPQRRCRSAVISAAFFRTINDFDAYPNCTGTVFEQIDSALRIVALSNPSRITFQDQDNDARRIDAGEDRGDDVIERTRRQETSGYPDLAIKEAITNAVVHRDYTRVGTEVQLRMYSDRLVLMSPGALLTGITPEMLRQDPHRSERRNPLVAEICFIDYWVERYGTGTTRMLELCREARLPDPEFIAEPGGFAVIFRKSLWTPERLTELGLNDRQIATVLALREEPVITTAVYMRVAGVSEATALRDLRFLTNKGVLLAQGAGRAAHYVLMRTFMLNPSIPS